MKTIVEPQTDELTLSRDERHWELFKLAFAGLHSNVFLEFPHPDGAGMCSVDPKEVLEQCKEISAIAWQSACHACDLFDEQGTVETFNKKLSKK
jgi:hypothetical protein